MSQDDSPLKYGTYDPKVGTFISPDPVIPDPTKVFAYNRYMYVYGNPLKYTDPSGHETNKPEGWPKFLPYSYDLPDELSYEGLVEWADGTMFLLP